MKQLCRGVWGSHLGSETLLRRHAKSRRRIACISSFHIVSSKASWLSLASIGYSMVRLEEKLLWRCVFSCPFIIYKFGRERVFHRSFTLIFLLVLRGKRGHNIIYTQNYQKIENISAIFHTAKMPKTTLNCAFGGYEKWHFRCAWNEDPNRFWPPESGFGPFWLFLIFFRSFIWIKTG